MVKQLQLLHHFTSCIIYSHHDWVDTSPKNITKLLHMQSCCIIKLIEAFCWQHRHLHTPHPRRSTIYYCCQHIMKFVFLSKSIIINGLLNIWRTYAVSWKTIVSIGSFHIVGEPCCSKFLRNTNSKLNRVPFLGLMYIILYAWHMRWSTNQTTIV